MKKKTILIADDSKDTIRLINKEIKLYYPDFTTIIAGNGSAAVRVAEEELPDIILMDWDMPIMNGIEATRILKNSERTRDIPVIITTGRMTMAEDLRIALEAGAIDYVRKPIEFVELTARVNTALRIRDQNLAIQELYKSEIELKNRKLTTTSMLIVEKNGLLSEFYNSLNHMEEFAEKEAKAVVLQIQSLKKRISTYMDIDKSWDTFKFHFEEVHPRFFSQIQSRGTEISHKDLKICAYLKLGMDNKEIANLLNITASSARVTLSRLKKKLQISEEENLREVIANTGE
ncbi:MAG: response regulator [Bacteroidota bacterium]